MVFGKLDIFLCHFTFGKTFLNTFQVVLQPCRLHHPAHILRRTKIPPPVGVYKMVEPLIHEGQGCVHFVSVAAALRFFLSLLCIIYFPYWCGLTHSCNESWSHGLFGVPGQRHAAVSQDHSQPHGHLRQPPVCSGYSWTVKVKPCWHICVSLPQANSYYICLLLCSGREKRQESNALLKTGMAKNTDSWRKADSRLSKELQLLIFLTRAVRWLRTGFERNVDGLMVAACRCLYWNICVFPRLVSMLLGNVIFLASV